MTDPNIWWDVQRHFAQAWANALTPGYGSASNPMDWMQAAQSAMRPDARALFERMAGAGHSFLDQAAQLAKVVNQAAAANQEKAGEALSQAVDALKRQWRGYANAEPSATNFWRQNLDAWNRFALAASGISTQTLPHWGAALAPPVGYLREHQEKWQNWLKCASEYATAQQAHLALLNEAMQNGLERTADRAADLVREGKAPDTLRKVYDLWVDCTEEAYAELATEERYARSQGQMMKALLELKAAGEALARPVLAAMGAADNATLDTVTRRLHDLQREVRELKERLTSPEAGAKPPRPSKPAPRAPKSQKRT